MKKFLIVLFASLALAGNAQASVLYNEVLSYDGTTDKLNDDSSGSWFDSSGVNKTTGTVVVGDVIRGIIRFDNATITGVGSVDLRPKGSTYFYGMYSLAVTAITAADGTSAGNEMLHFGAATGAQSLASLTTGWSGVAGMTSRASGDSAFMLLESTDVNLYANPNAVNTNLAGFNTAGTTVVTSAGFLGDDVYRVGGVAGTDVTNLTAFYTGINSINFAGTATVLEDRGPAAITYNQIAGSGLAAGTSGDLFLLGTIASDTPFSTNFDFSDNADVYINASVPEPSTIAIWAVLGIGGCGVVARRRKNAKKA